MYTIESEHMCSDRLGIDSHGSYYCMNGTIDCSTIHIIITGQDVTQITGQSVVGEFEWGNLEHYKRAGGIENAAPLHVLNKGRSINAVSEPRCAADTRDTIHASHNAHVTHACTYAPAAAG